MGLFDGKKKAAPGAKAVRMESVILRELWTVARDNFNDYVDHATRAEVHDLNLATAMKADPLSDEAYA